MSGRDKNLSALWTRGRRAQTSYFFHSLPLATPRVRPSIVLTVGAPCVPLWASMRSISRPQFLASFSSLSPINRLLPRFSSSNGFRRGRCASHSLPRVHHSLPRPSAYPVSVSTGSLLPFPSPSQTSNLLLQSRGVRIAGRFRKSEGGVYPTARACTFLCFLAVELYVLSALGLK